jgi:photosystem II reaction center protein PsbP
MTRRNRPALVAVAMLATVGAAACGGSSSPAASSTSPPPPSSASASPSASVELPNLFENARVSINYPADWEQRDQESGTLLLSPDRVAVVGVQVAVWKKGLTRLTDDALDVEKGSVNEFQLVDQRPGSLDGNDAIQFTYTGIASGAPSRAVVLWAVSGDNAYRVSYRAQEEAFDSVLPVAQAIIDSFQVR